MFKTGIHTLSQIRSSKNFKDIFGRDKKISITLYEQIQNEPDADKLAERILLLFTDARGAYKRTYSNRFEIFDQQIIEYIKQSPIDKKPITVHDVGVSDGRTAFDFFQILIKNFEEIDFTASDYDPEVFILTKDRYKIVVNKQGQVLEIVYPPFVLNMFKRENYFYYPFNVLISKILQKSIAMPLAKRYKSKKITAQRVRLFAPQVLRAAAHYPNFHLQQYNLLTPFEKKSNIIRAMNVLNPSYFSSKEFETVLRNIHVSLMIDGFFITGSNQDAGSSVNGGLYQKTSQGFKKLWSSGCGSPINEHIVDL